MDLFKPLIALFILGLFASFMTDNQKRVLLFALFIYFLGYLFIDTPNKRMIYPFVKVNSSDYVEIRPAFINDLNHPELIVPAVLYEPPTYIKVGSVYWARNTGSTQVNGMVGDFYCFIDGVAWIPDKKDDHSAVSDYVKNNSVDNILRLRLHDLHAPDWYKSKDQK